MQLIQKYRTLVERLINKQDVSDIPFTDDDMFEMQQLLTRFDMLVYYPNNKALQNDKLLQNAFFKDEFYNRSFLKGTRHYKEIIDFIPALKKLEDNETTEIDNNYVRKYTDVAMKYVFTRKGDRLDRYLRVEHIKDVGEQKISKELIEEFAENTGAIIQDDFIYADNENFQYTGYIKEDAAYIYPYNIRKNAFEKEHVKLFDSTGQIRINKKDLKTIATKMRDALAHCSVLEFDNGYYHGAKIFILDDERVLLTSQKWYEAYTILTKSKYAGKQNNFEYFYVPKFKCAIKNSDDLITKLNSCSVVKINTFDKYDKQLFDIQVNKILEDYYLLQKPIRLFDFLSSKLSVLYPDAQITIQKPVIDVLFARLSNDLNFYRMHGSDKNNAKQQDNVLKEMVEDVYGLDMVSDNAISRSGKFSPLKLNMRDCISYIENDVVNIQKIVGYDTTPSDYGFANPEHYLALCSFCIFNNLIENNFIGDINENQLSGIRGYVDSGNREIMKRELMITDMSMFTIKKTKGNKEEQIPKTLGQRMTVIRAIRNAVSHNNLEVQYNKTGNIKESTLIFTIESEPNVQIRVNASKFLDFINMPLFANYKSDKPKVITANSVKELQDKLIKLAKTNTSNWSW